ncbi:short-chain dehydrogenase reductase 3a-like [Lolium rigidum]|uniref:short-chain dehydrogenase reductase 3a-like n=1 Tax=Lolium rigidum TaxID=89674 RepID=UPI001F5C49F7|nr:short-chain dehydrogenase reductase 3a-like [Lolium rigidum]
MFQAMRLLLSATKTKSGAAGRASSGSSRLLSASSGSSRLAGKVAIITGAASGIGKATAAEFVRNGAKVIIADVQDDLGHAVAAELGGPDTACYARCDVTDEAQVAAAVARHGCLDVMFNNAGITGGNYAGGPIESMDMADFDRVMAVNLRGVAAGIKHAARAMVPRSQGCILCTASTAGVLGGSGPYAYSVSKTAVVGMVRTAAAELAARGVRVNAISPYAIATAMGTRSVREMLGLPSVGAGAGDEEAVRRVFDEDFNEMGGGLVLRAEDVARAAVFLASDDAKYITGHNLMVDGGFSVGKPLNVPSI